MLQNADTILMKLKLIKNILKMTKQSSNILWQFWENKTNEVVDGVSTAD